mmetsp:Transcript_8727/g.15751  ORF Transcript_8727/g.15751 Transcript_8727/m.15751 type:complete len:212 (-) Transcript_8727:726-1361(-)
MNLNDKQYKTILTTVPLAETRADIQVDAGMVYECYPATVAVQQLVPFPEREGGRIKLDKQHHRLGMSALRQAVRSISESPTAFPLIEWSEDESQATFGEDEDDGCDEDAMSLDETSATIASKSDAFSCIDKFLAGKSHRASRIADSRLVSPCYTLRETFSSPSGIRQKDDHGSLPSSCSNTRRRLVRSIALESHLALLDDSYSTSYSSDGL